MSRVILTKSGRQKMQDELVFLRGSETKRVLSNIAEARDKGDISESSEFEAAREQFEMLQAKIIKIENTLANSTIIDSNNIDTSIVSILTTVKVENKKSKKEMNFTIVPENEIDLKNGKISMNSPIGKGLIGKKINEIAKVQTPGGLIEFKVLKITA
jgi:transcription elongation factor GreA